MFHVKQLEQLIGKFAETWGIDLEEEHLSRLMKFARLVDDYSEANITGARDIESVVRDHVVDSISCLKVGTVRDARNAVDVGSGAGFPALPLAITNPDQRWTLVESTGKKTAFLRYAIRELGLSNVQVLNRRVEEVGHESDHRERFDIATARAVSSMGVLIEYCIPLLKTGGSLVAMKAHLKPEELDEARKASNEIGAKVYETMPLETPQGLEEKERNLVIVRKLKGTSRRYPRQVGVPRRSPLGT